MKLKAAGRGIRVIFRGDRKRGTNRRKKRDTKREKMRREKKVDE